VSLPHQRSLCILVYQYSAEGCLGVRDGLSTKRPIELAFPTDRSLYRNGSKLIREPQPILLSAQGLTSVDTLITVRLCEWWFLACLPFARR
jgi:hypothetical protein